MTKSSDLCLVLGAVLGIVAVYITPCFKIYEPDEKNIEKDKKSQNKSSVPVVDDDEEEKLTKVNLKNKKLNLTNDKFYGDGTVLEILEIIKNEISKLQSKPWYINIARVAEQSCDSTPPYVDARSEFSTINDHIIPLNSSLKVNDSLDESTEYSPHLNPEILEPTTKKRRIKPKLLDDYGEIRNLSEFKDNTNRNIPRQSTFLNTNGKNISSLEKTVIDSEVIKDNNSLGVDNNNLGSSRNTSDLKHPYIHKVKKYLNYKKNKLLNSKVKEDHNHNNTNS